MTREADRCNLSRIKSDWNNLHIAGVAAGSAVGPDIFNSLMILAATGLTSRTPIPRGGMSDLVLSWVLAALLIPIFIFGKAHLGRKTDSYRLVVYVSHAVVYVHYDLG